MSNPRDTMSDPSEATQAAPHPVSQHRTPREIAADEAGPIGKPDLDLVAKETSAASVEAKTQAKRPPPDIISKKQRKRR
jgi:hypothetical protein